MSKQKQFNKETASKANEMTDQVWRSPRRYLNSLEFKMPWHS
jgi:hypothetical protein